MLNKLTQKEYDRLITELSKKPYWNTQMLAYLQAFGIDTHFLQFYEQAEYSSVIMRWFDTFEILQIRECDIEEIAAFLNMQRNPPHIIGELSVMAKLLPCLNTVKTSITSDFALLEKYSFLSASKSIEYSIQRAELSDMPQIYHFLQGIKEFPLPSYDEFYYSMYQKSRHGCSRIYTLSSDGNITATAATIAESKESAMLFLVAVHHDYRGKGYGKAIVSKLCRDLLDEEKAVMVKYTNPAAKRLYASLGFNKIGSFMEVELN